MDFNQFLSSASQQQTDVLSRIARVIEQDPELALFGVSLASALKGEDLSHEQVLTYLTEVEDRLAQA